MSTSQSIELEMGLSEKDFEDVLANAVKPYTVTLIPNGYRLHTKDQEIHIDKDILSPRKIASIELPRMQVTLRFLAHSEQQVKQFMQRFNRYMHRGGG